MSTRAAVGVWTLALVVAAGATAIIVTSDHATDKATTLAFAVPTALIFVASGLIARSRQPENRTGALLVAVGLAWCLGALASADEPILFTAGLVLGSVFNGFLAHLLLAFPSGRLERNADRILVGSAYALVVVGPFLILLFDVEPNTECDPRCPENVLAVADRAGVARALELGYVLVAAALCVVLIVRLTQRWRRASPALRRALAPPFLTAFVFVAGIIVVNLLFTVAEGVAERLNWLALGTLLAVPLSFLYGLLRPRFGAATRRLVAELSEKRTPAEVQAVVRRVLHDPDLRLGIPANGGYVDVDGAPLELPAEGGGRSVTYVGDEVIVHDATLQDQPELEAVRDAAQIALERGITLRSLETSERRATALLEAIPDSMYRVASDGTFLEFRLSETARLPIDADDLIGMNVADVLSPEATADVLAAMRRAAQNDTVETVEYTLDYEGDARRYLEARVVKSGTDESVAIVRDVTERTLQERAVESLAEGRAALLRVAVAVATATTPDDVFTVVTEEVGRLFRADAANLIRFERANENEGLIVGRWSTSDIPLTAVGQRIELLGGAVTQVRRTGRPARGYVEDRARSEPALHARLTEMGITSYVAAPIEVAGELWGCVVVWLRTDEDFPSDAEDRLVQFGRLVSVALANAQAREELATLAEEQAALTRVAVAVATEEGPELLFDQVSAEVGKLLGANSAATVRYLEGEDATVIVGGWSREGEFDRKGVRVPFQGGAIARVRDSKLPERVDIGSVPGAVEEKMTAEGVSSQVAAPIVVSGRLWGATSVSIGPSERFASDAEERLGKFTNLVAVALANAEAREQLAGLAEEQAALSRVAVAVATEQEPRQLFNTVSREIGRLFRAQTAETVRFVEDDSSEAEIVGGWKRDGETETELELGTRLPFKGGAITRVALTGRPARIDLENEPPDIQRFMREAGVSSGVAAPIVVSGRLWGATSISILSSDRFPHDAEVRLEKFTRLVAVALANAEARAELSASRARIVQAGDAERRRLERNLHDGAQQRLVSLALALRLAQARLPEDPRGAKELLERASEELAVGLEELRELARGIHPAILTDRGLVPAIQALADRSAVPVHVSTLTTERLPAPVEAAAFYVVAESLTNVAKYASATEARVDVARNDGLLVVEVSDDGVGGADVSRGSGLRGLADRVEALDGRLLVRSVPGTGTTVRAELPLALPRAYAAGDD